MIYNKTAAPVIMDYMYDITENNMYAQRTYKSIKRAVNDLRQDIAMVTGAIDYKFIQSLFVDDSVRQEERLNSCCQKKVPKLILGNAAEKTDYAIIVGTISESKLINEIISCGKLDEAHEIENNQEAYVIKEVENPIENVKKALVIAGTDARGTIYGIYTISEQIGVSPFYWYSDVPVKIRQQISVDYINAYVNIGPDVKYRGIFINDEDISVQQWAGKKFPNHNGSPDVNYYRRVFELILRLKLNLLWPAMHETSTSFNKALNNDGIPINSVEASLYGVVMGSSHCDMMLRANTGEWEDWYNENKEKYCIKGEDYNKAYDFTVNKEAVLAYWRERLITNKNFESIFPLGIRGIHDGQFNCENIKQYNNDKVEFMKEVIKSQRKLLDEVYGSGASKTIPQVVIPYKEMGILYNEGLNQFLAQPEYSNITLMWAEDNFGYIRQTPTNTEKKRKGGGGVYYHASYYGVPSNYLWLNTVSLSTMSEQLHRAYDECLKDQWILNVGDIKPGDLSMEFFAKMAWDTDRYTDKAIRDDFLTNQVQRDYGLSGNDVEIAVDAICEYYRLISIKRPEFYIANTDEFNFSTTSNGDESLHILKRCKDMEINLRKIYEKLDDERKTAFYEQIYYHALSVVDAAEEYIYYWKHIQAVKQGRYASAKAYKELSKRAAKNIRNRVYDYNGLNGGKWAGYMSWENIVEIGREKYNHYILDDSEYLEADNPYDGIGAACEGSECPGNGVMYFSSNSEKDERYFDVFATGENRCKWSAETSCDWIILSKSSGIVKTEDRIKVKVDFSRLKKSSKGTIDVYGFVDGEKIHAASFEVKSEVSCVDYGNIKGFIESKGYVAVEAEHYSEERIGKDGSRWERIELNGQHLSTMKTFPDNTSSKEGEGASLVYNIHFTRGGKFKGILYRMPTLNEGYNDDKTMRSCNVFIKINKNKPILLCGNRAWEEGRDDYNKPVSDWAKNVMRMYEMLEFEADVKSGWNRIEIQRKDPSIVIDRFLIITSEEALGKSLLGPVESPNNISEDEVYQKVADLPEAIRD